MINYSKQAMKDYVDRIEVMQHKLSRLPLAVNGLGLDEMYWLVHVALDDLKRVAMKEWAEPFDAGQELFADLAREIAG